MINMFLSEVIIPVSLEPPAAPSIHLNSVHLPNQSEIVLNAGSAFSLSCHGNSTTHWSSTAFLLVNKEELANPLRVNNSVPKHTGTYRCGYTRQGLDHLDNWIHLYIKGPAHSASVFVTPRKAPETIKEGEDFLFKCLLTDPSVKNLTLQTEGSIGGNGQDEFVRLEGERFEVTCLTSNPSHHYYLTWTHPNIQTLNVTKSQNYMNNRLHINGTLTISAVSLNHSGPYTCSAFSEDGVTMATTQLRVLDRPYLRTYLQLTQHANATTTTIEVEDLFANVSITSVKKEPDTNISFGWKGEDIAGSINISGSIRVEVYEGQDVTLTFVIEAYPPIRSQDWTTPTHTSSINNTAYQESYTANGYRSEASLLLRRVRHEDQGRYLFHFSNSFFSRMQNIDVQIYRSPTAVVNLQNDTLTCTSSGYPLPTIRWYTCARLQDMCGDVSINHMSPMAVTSWEEEGEEKVRSHLPLSAGDDITVCVASNQLGDSRDVFNPWTSPSGQTGSLSFSDLMRFSYQVAQGLDFLSTRNLMYRNIDECREEEEEEEERKEKH
ncbi:hypothetical protein INR49_004622 [Caranx melampygus]|nr:hypothetical protein INR49_004622 [Caranx melampygus]